MQKNNSEVICMLVVTVTTTLTKNVACTEMQNGSREDAVLEGYRCMNPSCGGPLMPDPGMS